MPRPMPESGQFELRVSDLIRWKRRALKDGVIDQEEGKELLSITEGLASLGNGVIRSTRFAAQVLTGAHGMDSQCVHRAWDERQAELLWLDDYRAEDLDAQEKPQRDGHLVRAR